MLFICTFKNKLIMKIKIIILLAFLVISCSKTDPVVEIVLTDVETLEIKRISNEKITGRWNFTSPSASSKRMANCNLNWIEFVVNSDTDDKSYGKFYMKITFDTGSFDYFEGWYYIRYGIPTATDVPIDRITLFDFSSPIGEAPESGNVATFTNITFDDQNGMGFTFIPESNISEFCSNTRLELTAEKVAVASLQTIPQGIRNNLESILGNWTFFDLDVTYNESPIGIAEGYTHFCYWLDDQTKKFCSDSDDAYGFPIVDLNCTLLSPNLNPIRLAKVNITKYGSYILSYYDVSGAGVSMIDGSWRPFGEPDSNGNYASIEITKLTPGLGEENTWFNSIWEERTVFSIVGFDDDKYNLGTEMKLSKVNNRNLDFINTFSLLSEGTEYSLYQCPQIQIESIEDGKFNIR